MLLRVVTPVKSEPRVHFSLPLSKARAFLKFLKYATCSYIDDSTSIQIQKYLNDAIERYDTESK